MINILKKGAPQRGPWYPFAIKIETPKWVRGVGAEGAYEEIFECSRAEDAWDYYAFKTERVAPQKGYQGPFWG